MQERGGPLFLRPLPRALWASVSSSIERRVCSGAAGAHVSWESSRLGVEGERLLEKMQRGPHGTALPGPRTWGGRSRPAPHK